MLERVARKVCDHAVTEAAGYDKSPVVLVVAAAPPLPTLVHAAAEPRTSAFIQVIHQASVEDPLPERFDCVVCEAGIADCAESTISIDPSVGVAPDGGLAQLAWLHRLSKHVQGCRANLFPCHAVIRAQLLSVPCLVRTYSKGTSPPLGLGHYTPSIVRIVSHRCS